MDIAWDGTIASAVQQFMDRLDRFTPKYRDHMRPEDGWLTVTVDYHS